MQCFPFGVCSACLPPPSGSVSPWESAFGAFVQELFNFARGERERNVDKELLLKVKYHGPAQVQVLFFFSVNLPRCQLLWQPGHLLTLDRHRVTGKLYGLPAVRKQSVSFPESSCSSASRLFFFSKGSSLPALTRDMPTLMFTVQKKGV